MKSKNHILMILVFSMCIIGLLSIYSAEILVHKHLISKQVLSILIGIIALITCYKIGLEKLINYSFILYIIGIILLLFCLICGQTINGTKGWIKILNFSFQPSEFMKIPLILIIAKESEKYFFKIDRSIKSEMTFIIKVIILTLIPCILVFIEPDTGAVINYLLITLTILCMSNIRNIWWILFILIISLTSATFILTYIYIPKTFIQLFGSNFYYRINRLLNWSNSNSMQLENSLIAIGTGGLFGMGLRNTPIYIPEAYSDFIFSIFANNFGFVKTLLLLILILLFDLYLIYTIKQDSSTRYKYIATSCLVSLIFPQIISIGMSMGLMPIIGIPLPYISYGGSNIIVNLIFISLIIKSKEFYKNYKKI